MMNIAFIHTVFPGGGAERVTRDIAAGIRNSDPEEYSFFVYTPCIRHDIMTEDFARHFAKISSYDPNIEEDEIKRLIIEDKIDVVVQIARRINGIEKIREATGCKVVMANHGEPFHSRYDVILRKQHGFFRKVMWRMGMKLIYDDFGLAYRKSVKMCRKDYENCDIYTVLCEDYKTAVCKGLGVDEQTSHMVAINNSEPQVADLCLNKENIILFTGRFELFSKRIDRLLRIWKKAMNQLPDWRLVLAGDGYGFNKMKKMAEKLKLKNIEFLGYQHDMTQWYRKSSILCLTSQTEGWPLCLTEAQANGLIPIAFECTAGVRRILSPNRENGFLITPFDEDEYVSVLVEVASLSEEEKLKLRQNVVEKSKSYLPSLISQKWKKVFDELKQDSDDKDIL